MNFFLDSFSATEGPHLFTPPPFCQQASQESSRPMTTSDTDHTGHTWEANWKPAPAFGHGLTRRRKNLQEFGISESETWMRPANLNLRMFPILPSCDVWWWTDQTRPSASKSNPMPQSHQKSWHSSDSGLTPSYTYDWWSWWPPKTSTLGTLLMRCKAQRWKPRESSISSQISNENWRKFQQKHKGFVWEKKRAKSQVWCWSGWRSKKSRNSRT